MDHAAESCWAEIRLLRRMPDSELRDRRRTTRVSPLTGFGLLVALATTALDQASKLWLLYVYDLPNRAPVALTPFLDLVLAWNTGISFSLLPQRDPLGRWALLAFKAVAVVLLAVWLARTRSRLLALALGLIIGGAIGNGIDGFLHPGVVDFVLFHISSAGRQLNWYAFNLADAAIVAGVVGLLYETLIGDPAAKVSSHRDTSG